MCIKGRLILYLIPSWSFVHLRELMKKALPILVSVLEKEARGWFLHFREKVIADLKAQNLSDYEVEKVICLLLHCMYLFKHKFL